MSQSKIYTTLQFIFKPFTDRVKLGEGGLVVFNALHSAWASKSVLITIKESILSLLVITVLYGFNDYIDRAADLKNPKKDQSFVQAINTNPFLFLSLNLALSLLGLILVYLLLGSDKGLVLLALFIVNVLYSLWLKSFVIADILVVIAWGGLYAMLAGKLNWKLAAITGVMTGIAHIYQMTSDKPCDEANHVQTSAVRWPAALPASMALLCGITGYLLQTQLAGLWSLSACLPILFFIFGKNISLSWHASRLYFAICWLALLITTYGSF